MKTKEVHLGVVLSVLTGILVSPRDSFLEVKNLIAFLIGSDLFFTHEIPSLRSGCAAYLRRTFPSLKSRKMRLEIARLEQEVGSKNLKQSKSIRKNWLRDQIAIFGEKLKIHPIPKRLRVGRLVPFAARV